MERRVRSEVRGDYGSAPLLILSGPEEEKNHCSRRFGHLVKKLLFGGKACHPMKTQDKV